MSEYRWLEAYHKELSTKPDMSEIEWRFDCFKRYIIEKGLGYPSKLVRGEQNRTDIRISTPEGISHLVFETKIADAELEPEKMKMNQISYLYKKDMKYNALPSHNKNTLIDSQANTLLEQY